jgi:hypothetical protein
MTTRLLGLTVLLPLLAAQSAQAGTYQMSEWVFPHPSGARHPEGTDLVSIIRTALRRSQIASDWTHNC